MSNIANQITKLVNAQNQAAPATTHALAELGGGSMQKGLKRIVNYLTTESKANLKRGRVQGGLAGILITATIGGGAVMIHRHVQKKRDQEGQEILDVLEKHTEDTDSEDETTGDDQD